MKALKKIFPAVVTTLLLVASTQATAITIDFTGLNGTTDPIIGSVSFSAGDSASFNDTFVGDFVTPGNDYLLSGFADGTNGSPASGYDTFIGVTITGTLFGTVVFDIASDYNFPSFGDNTTLSVQAFLSGAQVASASTGVSDNNYVSLALNSVAGGFDSLFIFDDVNPSNLGEPFHIDNFVYTEYQAPCTGPGCNPNPAPEPAAVLLLGVGMAGLAYSRRRKSA